MKAHLDPNEEGLEEEEIFRLFGNGYADTAAQQGALSHPWAWVAEHAALDANI